MQNTIYELLWLFLAYSLLGWILETMLAAVRQKRFTNQGFINGPFCISYGFTSCMVTVFFYELNGIWLFIAALIFATVMEWIAGHVITRVFHEKWWDYSDKRWNVDGYICLQRSILWGIVYTLAVTWGNALLLKVFTWIPALIAKVSIIILIVILALDFLATFIILNGRSRNLERWASVDEWLGNISSKLSKRIYSHVNHRILRAYPKAIHHRKVTDHAEVFAYGCGFYKIFLLFMIGSLCGDLVETIFCRCTAGVWMSRSSVVWGPFSIVWGIAIAAATLLLYNYKDSSDGVIFVAGTFLGGAYEYICSVFTEIMFGKVFWDYSKIPFNLGGRINLLYCFFWGIAAVVWIKLCYPRMSEWIEKLPMRTGKIVTWLLVVFMACNIAVSCMALIRQAERNADVEPSYRWQEVIDERFPDERMKRIYPNAISVN